MTDLSTLLVSLQELQGRITMDRRHCYRMGKGTTVPGVTTVIKTMDAPALDAWKVRVQVEGTARAAFHNPPPELDRYEGADSESFILAAEVEYIERLVKIAKEEFEHERLANEAADIGHQVHALIEHEVKTQLGQPTEPPTVTDEALFTFAGWKEWAQSVSLEPLMAEGRIHHPMGYCGTFDLLALVKGSPAVLDWKPQARLYPERRMQSAAYREALHAMGWPPLAGYIVALPRDGGDIEMVPLDEGDDLAAAFDAFKACLSLYRWSRQLQNEERRREKVA